MFNKASSSIEIAVADVDEPAAYITGPSRSVGSRSLLRLRYSRVLSLIRTAAVQDSHTVPHHKRLVYRAGFLPCQFVRLRCEGTPASLYYLQPLGVLVDDVAENFGMRFHRALVERTTRLLLRPVVPDAVRVPHWTTTRMQLAVGELEHERRQRETREKLQRKKGLRQERVAPARAW